MLFTKTNNYFSFKVHWDGISRMLHFFHIYLNAADSGGTSSASNWCKLEVSIVSLTKVIEI